VPTGRKWPCGALLFALSPSSEARFPRELVMCRAVSKMVLLMSNQPSLKEIRKVDGLLARPEPLVSQQ
jgi:hypothetical protein